MSVLNVNPCTQSEQLVFEEVEHTSPFQCTIQVNPQQTSREVNHINNIEYLRWIDKGSQLHCDSCGWDRQRLLQAEMMWFVARHEIDYVSEASGKDQLRLTTWVDDIRRVKSWRATYIHAVGEKSRVVCKCKTLWVLVDLKTRKPKTVPFEMAHALQPLQPPKGLAVTSQ